MAAAEVNVMAGNALAGVIGELRPNFERATGHKLVARYGLSRTFKPIIEAGEPIDLIILSLETVDELAKSGKIVAGTRANIARTGIGIAVRTGASKPDINSVDAFKRSLLNAKSISWAPKTETGEYLATVFQRLGIVGEINARTKPQQAVAQERLAACPQGFARRLPRLPWRRGGDPFGDGQQPGQIGLGTNQLQKAPVVPPQDTIRSADDRRPIRIRPTWTSSFGGGIS
jgi:ABC-type molybdate transport system substrate-binding protein